MKTLKEKIEHLRNHVTNVDDDLFLIAKESEEYNIQDVRQCILNLNNAAEDALFYLDCFPEDIRKYSIPLWNCLRNINAIYFEKIEPPIPPSELTTVATSSATAGATTSPPSPPTRPLAEELTSVKSSATAGASTQPPSSPPRNRKTPFSSDQTKKRANSSTSKVKVKFFSV